MLVGSASSPGVSAGPLTGTLLSSRAGYPAMGWVLGTALLLVAVPLTAVALRMSSRMLLPGAVRRRGGAAAAAVAGVAGAPAGTVPELGGAELVVTGIEIASPVEPAHCEPVLAPRRSPRPAASVRPTHWHMAEGSTLGSTVTEKLTYQEVGATRRPEALPPPGYHLLRVRTRIGAGPGVLSRAGQAVLDWRMHRAVGVSIDASAAEAAPGVQVAVSLGLGRFRLRAPCEVVWTVREEDRVGFGYGTLPGHPEDGEEAFLVERDPSGAVWLAVTAFSRPARWYLRAAGPLARVGQRAYAHRCGRVLRRIAAS